MSVKFKYSLKEYILMFFIGFFVETSAIAHMGITPFKVLGSMERQGTGPFSLSKPNAQDAGRIRMGVSVEQDSYGDIQGLLIHKVRKNSPTARAGITYDDFIVYFNSKRVTSVYDLESYIKEVPTGGIVPVIILRDGVKEEFFITFTGAYEKSRIRVGPSSIGMSGDVGPGKMLKTIKDKKIGPGQVFKRMKENGTGPFSVMRNSSMNKKDSPVIPPIGGGEIPKLNADKPTVPKIKDEPYKAERVYLDELMGNFSVYIENKDVLGLNSEQLSKIKKLDLEQKKKNFQKETQLKLVQVELSKIFSKGVDFVAVRRLLNFASDVERNWRLDYINSLENLYLILTPTQKSILANP